MAKEKDGIKQWESAQLKEKMKDEDVVLIDVRELDEYVGGHIPGVPLLPMGEIADHIEEMDRSKTHVFICRSGGRSQRVAKFAKENGLEDVVNFEGGMLSWDEEMNTGEEKRLKDTSELYN